MAGHPIAYDDLIAFALGDLGVDRANAVASHVAACPACAATVARLGLVRETVRADAQAAPAAASLAYVRRLAGALPGSTPAPGSWFRDTARRLVATLAFDGREAEGMIGLRGSGTAYLLSFQEKRGALDLQVEPPGGDQGNRWLITGQLSVQSGNLPADLAIVPVTSEGGLLPVVTTTDEHGVFTVDLDPGRYEIIVDVVDGVLVFSGIETE